MLEKSIIDKMKAVFKRSLCWQSDWQFENMGRVDNYKHQGDSYCLDAYRVTHDSGPIGVLLVWIRNSYDDIRKIQLVHMEGSTTRWTRKTGLFGRTDGREHPQHVQYGLFDGR